MQFRGGDAGLGELAGKPLRPVLGPGEHERALLAAGQRGDHRDAVGGVDGEHVVLDLGGRGVLVHRVQHRVTEEAPCEHVDGGVERGGKQHPLAAVRCRLEQPADNGQEAEVGHLVRLVDDRDLDVGQVALALPDQVGEPARGRDDDVGPALQRVHLRAVGDPAVNGGDPQAHRPGQRLEHVRHLAGELTGRHEHQAARPAGRGRPARQPADHGEREAQGLAGAGARPAEDVPAGQGVGQCGRLNGERRGDAVSVEDVNERGGHAKLSEARGGSGQGRFGHRSFGRRSFGRRAALRGHGTQRKIVSRTRVVAPTQAVTINSLVCVDCWHHAYANRCPWNPIRRTERPTLR